jgi:hypothetical protein
VTAPGRRGSIADVKRPKVVSVLPLRFAISWALLSVILSIACARKGGTLTDIDTARYHVGETWKYQTRPGEEGSTLTVVKVESSPRMGVIVHISLRGLRIKNLHAPNGITTEARHLPMAEQALQKSVTEMVRAHGALPSYEEGYRAWRSAFDSGNAGAFTISVADAIAGMEQALNDSPRKGL